MKATGRPGLTLQNSVLAVRQSSCMVEEEMRVLAGTTVPLQVLQQRWDTPLTQRNPSVHPTPSQVLNLVHS